MPEARLYVGGEIWGGWTSVIVNRSIEGMSGSFDLGLTEAWPDQTQARPIRPGVACTVKLGETTVITGYVDEVAPSYDARQHTLTVRGRDRTADLIDCSAENHPGQWKNQTLKAIAEALCEPFKIPITISLGVSDEEIPSFTLDPGETPYSALGRLARMKGILLVSDGVGGLKITRAGLNRVKTALVLGENIVSASGTFSHRDRFSSYTVLAETQKAIAKDPAIFRYRPHLQLSESPGSLATYQKRAEWERSVRRGRGTRATITVQGWEHSAGLWQPNHLVTLQDAFLLSPKPRTLLIVAVSSKLDERGTLTELQLAAPEAFAPEPYEIPTEAVW